MVSHLISDLQKFDEELSREHYLNSSGQKDELDSSKIYKKFTLYIYAWNAFINGNLGHGIFTNDDVYRPNLFNDVCLCNW